MQYEIPDVLRTGINEPLLPCGDGWFDSNSNHDTQLEGNEDAFSRPREQTITDFLLFVNLYLLLERDLLQKCKWLDTKNAVTQKNK